MNTELQDADTASTPTPMHIEAEAYIRQSGGIYTETCTDTGGGQNLTNIYNASWAEYSVTVPTAGTYLLKFRVAGSGGTFQWKDSSLNVLTTLTVPNTGGGQTWTTVTATVVLPAGTQKLHFYTTWYGWNLNWFELVLRGANGSNNQSGVGGYRYGFNGKENDNEMQGEGNLQDYGMRIYEPRLGRFLSVDPISRDYPELTPYQFASNTPIKAVDLDGLETSWKPKGQLKADESDHGSRSESTGQYRHVDKSLYSNETPNKVNEIKACDHCPPPKPSPDDDKPNLRTPQNDPVVKQIRKENIEIVENSPTNIFPVISNLKKAGKYELLGMHGEATSSLKDAAVEVVVGYGINKAVGAGLKLGLKYLNAAQGVDKVKYIGRLEDLQGIPRSQTLLDDLPNLGSPKANYYQNMSVLRKTLRDGYTIKDASWFRPNSELAPTLLRPNRTIGQTFLGAERLLLKNRGLWP